MEAYIQKNECAASIFIIVIEHPLMFTNEEIEKLLNISTHTEEYRQRSKLEDGIKNILCHENYSL